MSNQLTLLSSNDHFVVQKYASKNQVLRAAKNTKLSDEGVFGVIYPDMANNIRDITKISKSELVVSGQFKYYLRYGYQSMKMDRVEQPAKCTILFMKAFTSF